MERIEGLLAFDGEEEMALACCGAQLRKVDGEEANRITLERLLGRLVAVDLRQAAVPMPLEAAIGGRAGQVLEGRLQRPEAIVERQELVAPKGHHDGYLGVVENR
jgi:hypothetical protein